MRKLPAETRLCAVFVDYDNIYLSLRRQDEVAAKQFPKSVIDWLRELETGELINETGHNSGPVQRRLVMCRCYGNPVPRRNSHDNSTDIGSFPFVRHHFLRAGFDIVDCPPLTSQLKNSSDIRMVMDIQDFLDHKTYFDEFIILSGDADFAPILQRLRTHARNTTIYVNENTAVPYVALCDGQVREQDLLARMRKYAKQEVGKNRKIEKSKQEQLPDPHEQTSLADIRNQITTEIEHAVSSSQSPVALSFLADKAQRTIGYEETVGSNWAGYGSFLSFLQNNLPETMRITTNQPYYVVDERRHGKQAKELETTEAAVAPVRNQTQNYRSEPVNFSENTYRSEENHHESNAQSEITYEQPQYTEQNFTEPAYNTDQNYLPARQQEANSIFENNKSIRNTISRVHEYTHVPALAPSEYQIMFEAIASELDEVGLKGRHTAFNISTRAKIESVDLSPDDAQFVLDIISEADPWFEKGISPPLFAERFLNAIIARCRSNGLHLSQDEYDLVAAWFTGNTKSLYHQRPDMKANRPQLDDQRQAQQAPWLLPNDQPETLMEPAQQLRQPYLDPLNPHQDPATSKELPRMFRFGSDG